MSGDEDMHFPIYLGHQYPNILGYMAIISYRIFIFMLIFLYPAQAYQTISACFHVKFQLYMWNKFIDEIINEKIILNKNCQDIVNLRLKYCINRHLQLL